jgi:integrase
MPPKERAEGLNKKRGRPRKGQVTQYTGGRLGARVTRDIDGEPVRKRVKLDTLDDAVAKKKLLRLAKSPEAPVAIAILGETFQEASERVIPKRSATPQRSRHDLGQLALHVWPLIGATAMTAVTVDDIETVLDAARDKGLGWQSVKHIKNKINVVFKDVKRDKKLPYRLASNPVLAVTLPEFAKVTKKVTAVLRDEELLVYLGWVHPVERFREAVLQRQVMSVIGRCFGGERTGDMHANCWEDFQIEDGAFPSGWAPREKTGLPQRLEIPAPLRPILRAYWIAQGKPLAGPLFPLLRGERTGGQRDGGSHAGAFRIDLQRAFGIQVWGPLPRSGGKPGRGKPRLGWRVAREMTERERELFLSGRYTEPVVFHSSRAAFSIGLKEAGLSVSEGAARAGHGDLATHIEYRRDRGTPRTVPAAALPDLATLTGKAESIFGSAVKGHQVANISESETVDDSERAVISEGLLRARKDSNLRPLASESPAGVAKGAKTLSGLVSDDGQEEAKTPSLIVAGLKWWPQIERALTLSADELSDLVTLATEARRWDLVRALSAQLEALAVVEAPLALEPETGIIDVARFRRRKGEL